MRCDEHIHIRYFAAAGRTGSAVAGIVTGKMYMPVGIVAIGNPLLVVPGRLTADRMGVAAAVSSTAMKAVGTAVGMRLGVEGQEVDCRGRRGVVAGIAVERGREPGGLTRQDSLPEHLLEEFALGGRTCSYCADGMAMTMVRDGRWS